MFREFVKKIRSCRLGKWTILPSKIIQKWFKTLTWKFRVRTQHSKYKKKSEGHAVNFFDEQIKRLNDIGFCWDCKTDDNWKEHENNKRYLKSGALWDERYERLLKVRTTLLETYIGTKGYLCLKLLTSSFRQSNLIWVVQGNPWCVYINEFFFVTWFWCFAHFQNKLGHCNVPKVHKEDQVLSSWVYCQRKQYKLKQEGKQNSMKDDRLIRLVEVRVHTKYAFYYFKSFISLYSSDFPQVGFSFRTRGAAQAQIQTCDPEDSDNKSSIAMGSVAAKSQACGSEDSDNKSSIDLTEEMLAVKNSSRKLIKARKYISNNVKEASSKDDVEGEPDLHSVSGIGSMILGQWINSSKMWLVWTFQRGRENTWFIRCLEWLWLGWIVNNT